MVASETIGNITRPPNRSVSAPTGMRPSEPTTTGTATSSACWNARQVPSAVLEQRRRAGSAAPRPRS